MAPMSVSRLQHSSRLQVGINLPDHALAIGPATWTESIGPTERPAPDAGMVTDLNTVTTLLRTPTPSSSITVVPTSCTPRRSMEALGLFGSDGPIPRTDRTRADYARR
jgi:hypothetical protein